MAMILGIDPGTHVCGFALLCDGALPIAGQIKLDAALRVDQRIGAVIGSLDALLAEAVMAVRLSSAAAAAVAVQVAMERPPNIPNRPAPSLAAAAQGIRDWCRQRKYPLTEYSPQTWRQVCAMPGLPATQVKKGDVLWWVQQVYAEAELTVGDLDAAEALAIATWHADRMRLGIV